MLNKTDLIGADAGERLKREVLAIVPRAVKVVAAQEGRVDADVLLGLGAAAEDDLAARPSHHDALDGAHEHDDFESFVVAVPEIGDPADLLARLQAVAETHDVLRIKGFVSVDRQADAPRGAGRRRALPLDLRPALAERRRAAGPYRGDRRARARPRRHRSRHSGLDHASPGARDERA